MHRVLAELLLNDSLLDIATRSAVYFQLIEVVDAASRVGCNMLFRFATRSVADHSLHHDRMRVAGGVYAVRASVRRVEAMGPPAAQVHSALQCCGRNGIAATHRAPAAK